MKFLTIVESIGEGIISLPVTFWHGIERTGEDIGLGGIDTFKNAWAQNIRLYHLVVKLGEFAVGNYQNPLVQAIEIILRNYYNTLSDEAKNKLYSKAQKFAAHKAGSKAASAALAFVVAKVIAEKIAKTEAVKRLIKSGVKVTGMLLTIQGVIYQAGQASDRLKKMHPRIYYEMKKHDLDMLYFLIEEPMKKYLTAIRYSHRHQTTINIAI